MIGKQTSEVLESIHTSSSEWCAYALPIKSATYENSPVIFNIWGDLLVDSSELILLHRFSDNSCLIFRKFGHEFTLLPALFRLELAVFLVEPINDVGVLHEIEAWAKASGKLIGNLWRLK